MDRPSRAALDRFTVALERRVGAHKIVTDPDLLLPLGADESGLAAVAPDLALRAEGHDDLVAALGLAAEHGVPVTPRGGGTGKSGGAIPVAGGLVLDTSRLNRLVDIDHRDLVAVVEPGMLLGDFQGAVEAAGLFYPPDPNSLETCCLGGNVAENAGGPRAFKYGVTREWVLGLDAVLMGGEALGTGHRTVKGVAGYDLTSLLVGSEGTLAVFSRLTLRLRHQPRGLRTLLVRFADERHAVATVGAVVASGLVPRVLEFLDQVLVETVRQGGQVPLTPDTAALLIAELDGDDEEALDRETDRFAELCDAHGAIEVLMARHGGEREKLWAARRELSEAIKRRARRKVSEDVVVPRGRALELLDGLRELGRGHDLLFAAYGHAGDGNYHVNILWDDPGRDVSAALDDLMRLVLSLAGSITGEHGVGLAKRRWLTWEQGARALELQRGLKRIFDPQGLLNPGKIF